MKEGHLNYKILLKDAKVGMIIMDGSGNHGTVEGLILKIDVEGKDKFFDGEPNVLTLCPHDAYHGPGWQSFDPESEVTVVRGSERAYMLEKYIGQTMQSIWDRERDLAFLKKLVDRSYED